MVHMVTIVSAILQRVGDIVSMVTGVAADSYVLLCSHWVENAAPQCH